MREYELMYILDPSLDEDSTQALIGQIEDFMSKQGVTIDKTDPWGKRRLAYQISKHWEGYYVLSLLKADAGAIGELERRLRVTDGVLRFITVRVDEEQAKLERQRARKSSSRAARQKTPETAEPTVETSVSSDATKPEPAPEPAEAASAEVSSPEASDPPEKTATEAVAAPADTAAAEQPDIPERKDEVAEDAAKQAGEES
jgi:small subunit ribosomal protein S6